MKAVIAISFIFLSCQLSDTSAPCDYIQHYYPLVYQADYAYESGNYQAAAEFYQKAFKRCKPVNTPVLNELGKYAEVCARLGQHKQALKFIELDLQTGMELKWMLQDTVFAKTFSTLQGIELVARYEQIRADFLKQVNMPLREEIIHMEQVDQMYRANGYIPHKADSVDKLHEKRLIEIFETHGFPGGVMLGHGSMDNNFVDVTTLLLHTGDSIRMNYFVPKMKEFVKAGTCPPLTLGQVIDQYYLYNKQPQIYGTYQAMNARYAPMIDRAQANKNRLSIGLPTLELMEKTDSVKAVKYPWMRR